MRPRTLTVAVLAAAVMVGACGSGETTTDGPTGVEEQPVKPEITVPEGEPPTELVVNDITDGDGEVLEAGDTATMHYVGVSYSTGEQFDASWDRGAPFSSEIPGRLIEGWNEGLLGMRVGGRRELVIPPDMAYGAQSPTPAIGPNETLVFVVDLLDVDKG